jgi:hypothetical protein
LEGAKLVKVINGIMITDEIKNSRCYRYAMNVVTKKIIAGENIILACNRFLKDLERNDLEFRIKDG